MAASRTSRTSRGLRTPSPVSWRPKSIASAGGTAHQKAACASKLGRCRLVAQSCQQAENTGSSPPRTGERESNEAGDHTDKEARPEPGHVEAHLPRSAGEGVQ